MSPTSKSKPPHISAAAWISFRLDTSIDQVARDGSRMMLVRWLVLALGSVLVSFSIGASTGTIWAVLTLVLEVYCVVIKRRLFNGGSPRWRIQYVLVFGCLSLTWAVIPLLLWATHESALQMLAILVSFGQLIHAQAFAFRSPLMLTLAAGPAAAGLLIFPAFFGSFENSQLAALESGSALSLVYLAVAVRANRVRAAELAAAQTTLERAAYYDELTSLANRRLFSKNLSKLITTARQQRTKFTLLVLDLDQFKSVNDTFGHATGDIFLAEVGARLCGAVRSGDQVARIGGDEFAILLPDTWEAPIIAAVCRRLIAGFVDAILINGSSIIPRSSMGIAIYPEDGGDPASLLHSADVALYKAKRDRHDFPQNQRARITPICCYQSGMRLATQLPTNFVSC